MRASGARRQRPVPGSGLTARTTCTGWSRISAQARPALCSRRRDRTRRLLPLAESRGEVLGRQGARAAHREARRGRLRRVPGGPRQTTPPRTALPPVRREARRCRSAHRPLENWAETSHAAAAGRSFASEDAPTADALGEYQFAVESFPILACEAAARLQLFRHMRARRCCAAIWHDRERLSHARRDVRLSYLEDAPARARVAV